MSECRKWIWLAVAGFFFAGCTSWKYAEKPNTSSDTFKISEAVYEFMLHRHLWDTGEYTAVFLKGGDEEVAELRKRFPDQVPPIKPSYRAQVEPNQTPVDRDTGRPAMILSVEVLEPEGDQTEAIGSWYGGAAVTGHYRFKLKKLAEGWQIQSVQ